MPWHPVVVSAVATSAAASLRGDVWCRFGRPIRWAMGVLPALERFRPASRHLRRGTGSGGRGTDAGRVPHPIAVENRGLPVSDVGMRGSMF